MLENDTKHEHNEMMRDKMRKISMCGDQDRIMNSNLIDKMATIAGQIALVARMGDENSDTMNDMTDDLDDSEHVHDSSFALKADSHNLDGSEAFSFDQVFDEDVQQVRPFQIGSMFEALTTDEDGVLHLSSASLNQLEHHLEHVHIVGVFDFTLNTSPESMPLYFSKMISSSKLLNVPELFNISIPDSLHDIEGMILGLWGPILHPPNNQLEQNSSSGRVLYLVLKCQSLYQSMNALNQDLTQGLSQSHCILKCATMISLLAHNIILCTDIPIDRTSADHSPVCEVQSQSSQIISSFLVSLSNACCQLVEENSQNDETLGQKLTFPPSLCIIREFTQHLHSAMSRSIPLKSLYSSLLSDGNFKYFHQNAFYLQELCLNPSNQSPQGNGSVNDNDSVLSYDTFAKLLNNLLVAHLSSQIESKSNQGEDCVVFWNGPYALELTRIYLTYVESFYKDYNCVPSNQAEEEQVVEEEPIEKPCVQDELDKLEQKHASMESVKIPTELTSEQSNIISNILEKYQTLMLQSFQSSSVSPLESLKNHRNLETGIEVLPRKIVNDSYKSNSGNTYDLSAAVILSPTYDAVDPDVFQTLRIAHNSACDSLVNENKALLQEYSLTQHLEQLFQDEYSKYERHEYSRSLKYNEIVLQDCLVELSLSKDDSVSPTKISEVLEVYFHRARGPAKQNVASSFLSKYFSNSQLQSENEILKGQLHQYHANHLKMRSRLEELATENSQLHKTVEEKTDKALDAWAALHEKYSNLERSLTQLQTENQMKDDYINKLRLHITQIEKMNAAMKYGVNKLLEEEGSRQANKNQNHSITPESRSSIFDMLSFAIACATGAPIDTVDEDDSKRSSSNSSGGFNWEPTFENPTNPGSSQQMLYENPKQTE